MAIDRNRTRELLDSIDEFFDSVSGFLPVDARQFLKRTVMGPALDEIRRLITESRPPSLFLAGRSGHGKSSLINALSGRNVAPVGDVKPTTPESIPYLISFQEPFSAWQVIDSRGIFETTRPDGAPVDDALRALREDLLRHKPDVILHVISAPEIRNLAMDLTVMAEMVDALQRDSGLQTPVVVVVNKADTLGNPRDWPPEKSAHKAALIHEALQYLTGEALGMHAVALDAAAPYRGLAGPERERPAVIAVCSLPGENWNIDVLADFIGARLPEAALLDYYQALRRREQLRRISSSLIKRFAVIASGVGASPLPLSDFLVLAPMQMLMIAMIGGLSCRPVSKETAHEYLSAIGVNLLTAGGLRYAAQQLLKLLPIGGWAASGSIAASGTFALGKAAEAYFFSGELKQPEQFRELWTEKASGQA
ncbi:MAG: GTP-binding DUF697 domain-containing protein [Leptospirales bacterium]|nr:GTP-binding DUF697 domain-containing protein [Leptospirales bacterium]